MDDRLHQFAFRNNLFDSSYETRKPSSHYSQSIHAYTKTKRPVHFSWYVIIKDLSSSAALVLVSNKTKYNTSSCTSSWKIYHAEPNIIAFLSAMVDSPTRIVYHSSVQFSSVTQLCPTLWDSVNCCTPRLPVHHQLPEFTQTHVHCVGGAIQPSHPLSSPFPPAHNSSQHQSLFQWVNSSHEVAKVLEFQIQHHSLQRTPRADLFRMDWLDLLAVQGILKSLLQHHSSKASILQCSAFFTVQLSHPYMTTGKTITLTRWTFVGKVMSLLLNMLSRLVINFLSRSKCHLISWLQSPTAVILESPQKKSDTVSPSISYEVMGPDDMILVFWMLSF